MTWILVAAALAAVAWAVAGQLDAPAWLKASVAGLAAAAAGAAKLLERRESRVSALRARERTLHEHLRFWALPRGRLYRVNEVDPRSLGVERRAIEPLGGRTAADVYVPRPEDESVRRALREQAFTLVVGGSKVGKTRTAYEAARTICPEHSLVVPENAASLFEILTVEPPLDLGEALVWLDGLDAYLEREGGLTLNLLTLLTSRDPPVKIVATIATSAFDRYTAATGVSKTAHLVLAHAATIFLHPLLDGDAVRSALGSVSESFVRNVVRYGLGAALVAGPDLVRRLERGDDAVGVAIVRAAADWRRAGISSPVPEGVLERLVLSYLENARPTSDEAFRAGLDWALFEIHPGTALVARRTSQPAEYAAATYVIEHIERQGEAVDSAVWREGLALQSVADRLALGLSAYARDRLDIAEAAFGGAAEAGSEEGAYNLAVVLEERGRWDDASSVRERFGDHPAPGFELISWELAPAVDVVRPLGELDLYTAGAFKQALLDLITRGSRRIIVDFTETTSIESTTLGVLVGVVKRLRSNDGQLVIVCDRKIRRIFEITGLDRVFVIYPTLDEAANSIAARGQTPT